MGADTTPTKPTPIQAAVYVAVCNRCPRRLGRFCGITSRRKVDHATSGECPHPDGSRFALVVITGDVAEIPGAAVGQTCKVYIGSAAVNLSPPQPRAAPLPRNQWPFVARTLAMLARPDDRGLGDVIARFIGYAQGDRWAKVYKWVTGRECGCGSRHARLNQEYPFRRE